MIVTNEKLKYTKATIPVYTTSTGLEVWKDIDSYYRGNKFRDKVICRIDTIKMMKDMFTEEVRTKHRDAIFNIAAAQLTEAAELSKFLLLIAANDTVFASKLNEYYYTCDIGCSFGEYIVQSIADKMLYQETRFREFFRGKTQSVICLSKGYLYICVPDSPESFWMPENVEVEVLSYAKSWNGQIKW